MRYSMCPVPIEPTDPWIVSDQPDSLLVSQFLETVCPVSQASLLTHYKNGKNDLELLILQLHLRRLLLSATIASLPSGRLIPGPPAC